MESKTQRHSPSRTNCWSIALQTSDSKTLAKPTAGQMFTRVVNLKDEDVWLSPRTRMGFFHTVDCVHNSKHKVEISRISVKAEVTLDSDKARHTKAASCPLHITDVNYTPKEKEELRQLLLKHADIFIQEGDELGYTETCKHRIPTTDDLPVSQPFQRISLTQYQEVNPLTPASNCPQPTPNFLTFF